MTKQGRPGISYEEFIEVWERLIEEGRATVSAACAILGGSRSTLMTYRQRYEQADSVKILNVIKQIKLPEEITRAVAGIKLEEMQALEEYNKQAETRLEECVSALKNAEVKREEAIALAEALKKQSEVDKLDLERKLAAADARIADFVEREQRLQNRFDEISDKYNQAKQEALVAKREIELLREMRGSKASS